ncbi:MAG: DUF4167 domain-containing protein [Alphaproteobacteria bacterium]|nr:DUF4167 domain-containing protein [Alphaproteobacteria bacterium]
MRSGQQNKRGRGRNNNNNNGRKSGNPLSRTYDSTGPDVKIRGNAQHIADKYSTMARDALGSGDTVMAENYFQHAEHYNRIIATAQAQMQERYQREEREKEQPAAEQSDVGAPAEKEQAAVVVDGSGPQPVISGTPAEVAIEEDDASQPARRQPTRRRSAMRPRRPRNGANGEGNEAPAAADAGNDGSAPVQKPAPATDAQEAAPEVAAAATEV